MPNIIITKDSLLRGIAPGDRAGGNVASLEAREGEYARSDGIDLFRQSFEGHITPAQIFSSSISAVGAITGTFIDSLPRAITRDLTDPTQPYFGINGGLSGTAPSTFRLTNVPAYATSGTFDYRRAIALGVGGFHSGHNFTTLPSGTGFWGEDIVAYAAKVAGTLRSCIFYSWNDNTDGDIGQYVVDVSAGDDYWLSRPTPAGGVVLTKNVPHRMVEGADKKLYITNGRYVSSYDGSNGNDGTFVNAAYDLGQGWVATDVRVHGNLLAISGVKCGATYLFSALVTDSKVNFWDMVEPGQGVVTSPDDNFVSALYTKDGRFYSFSQGTEGISKLKYLSGNSYQLLKEISASLYGQIPDPRSIEFFRSTLVWAANDYVGGFILVYDPKYGGFHIPYLVNDGTNPATAIGFVKSIAVPSVTTENLFVGVKIGGTYKIIHLTSSAGYAGASNIRLREYRLPFRSTIKKITVFFSQMASGSTAQISLFKNYVTTSVGTVGTDFLAGYPLATMSFASDGALTEREILCTIPNVSAFYLNVRVAGQISISEIVVEWESTK